MANLIDKVTYTASLVTHFDAVDVYLDELRAVSSRNGFSPERPSDQDKLILERIQEQLEDYLVTKEPLRLFTRESLRTQIEQEMAGNKFIRPLMSMILVFGAAIAGTILSYMLPGLPDDNNTRLKVAAATAFSLLHLGAAALFLAALPAFKSSFRQAFVPLCIGIAALGLSLAQLPILDAFNLEDTIYEAVIAPIPFVIAFLGIALGIRRYAVILKIKSKLLSRKAIVGLGTVMPLVLWPLFYFSASIHASLQSWLPLIVTVQSFMIGWMILFTAMSALMIPRITRQLAELYRPPVRALGWSIFGIFCTFAVSIVVASIPSSHPLYLASYGLFIVVGALFVYAGYLFNRVIRY